MEPAIRGLVLDSSVLVAAERAKLTTPDVLRNIRAMTVAELAHGIYRADSPERRQRRRQFVDELKAHIPVHPVTEAAAEIIARIGGEQAAKGINLPVIDLIIGAGALELGYAIGTDNTRDFNQIPDLKVISPPGKRYGTSTPGWCRHSVLPAIFSSPRL